MTPILFTATAFLSLWLLVPLSLWVLQGPLLRRTWSEPYLSDLALVIESDDWGPGPSYHAERLRDLTDMLSRHLDAEGRPGVLTADVVLAVPDIPRIRSQNFCAYFRRTLEDGFDPIYRQMIAAMEDGLLVPQLHGLEHLHGSGLVARVASGDDGLRAIFTQDDWSDWESLDSPLQAHYVDGTRLPTRPLDSHTQRDLVSSALESFQSLFGFAPESTVAPCYLWDSETERQWAEHGIRYIQTAGYRCTGRDHAGHYIQDPPLIRPGDPTATGLRYLVRNAMYEPVDGRGPDACFAESVSAWQQGLPVVISTHRYNFTGDKAAHDSAVKGLSDVLSRLAGLPARLRFLSSPELGAWLDQPAAPLQNVADGRRWPSPRPLRGWHKLSAFLLRLWVRHRKLRLVAILTGLVLPALLLAAPRLTRR